MNCKSVSSIDFSQIEGIRQVISHDHSRKFLTLDLGTEIGNYGLAWRSDLIEPIIKLSPAKSHIWVGVDQQVAAICLGTGQICLKFSLSSNLVRLDFLGSTTSVLSESEVLLIDFDFSIKEIHSLPEIPNSVSLIGSQLKIDLAGGQTLILTSL